MASSLFGALARGRVLALATVMPVCPAASGGRGASAALSPPLIVCEGAPAGSGAAPVPEPARPFPAEESIPCRGMGAALRPGPGAPPAVARPLPAASLRSRQGRPPAWLWGAALLSGHALSRPVTASAPPDQGVSAAGGAAQPQGSEGMLLAVLIAALVGVSLSVVFRSAPSARRRRSPGDSPLVPSQRRWGVSHHERLQDPKYLSRILEVETASSGPDGHAASASTSESPPPPGDGLSETSVDPTGTRLH